MKKKTLIIIIIVFAALATAAAAYFIINANKKEYYEPEMVEPEVFEDVEYDTDLLLGLWHDGTLYYRYNEDGTGATWDVADDVTEAEAQPLDWELNHARFIHLNKMDMGGVIPKAYTITSLELNKLEYKDDYGVKYVFEKAE